MPVATSSSQLSALIGFTLPAERLDHSPDLYLKYDPKVTRPSETIRCPVIDLRPELEGSGSEGESGRSVETQLSTRGFAIAKHHSDLLDSIPSEEGTAKYLDECCQLLKAELGCSRVIAWNSVCRRNDPENVKLVVVERQKGPEEGFIPSTRLQPIAGMAHVDQDASWGKELCGKAAALDPDTFKRCQIVNIWRPLIGPVTNAPLAMLSYPSLRAQDVSVHGHLFGVGLDIHHHPDQEWSYIRHQQPDEIIYLKCFDSWSTRDYTSPLGPTPNVPYSAHVAVDVGEQDVLPGGRARESIEVRLVAIWE